MKPTLITFLGALGSRPGESLVGTARYAATLDTIESALSTGAFSGAVLVTDSPHLKPDIPNVELDIEAGAAFHFGRRLAGLLRRRNITSALYLGGGSLPLLTAEDFAAVARTPSEGGAVTNNNYSSDLVAFNIPSLHSQLPTVKFLKAIASAARDNALARNLSDAGLALQPLPRTIETQFDIDSPADLAVLSLTHRGGPRLQAYLQALDLDLAPYQRLLPIFLDTTKQLLVAGRIGSHAWAYLERETACRVRLFAEERGMEAEGRTDAGVARSLLGFYLDAVGLDRFFQTLPELADAAVIDTRVLLAHKRIAASREDRFLSDLGRYGEISDPFLRDFTRAAREAPIPILLGGHSLMSGGLMLLNEHAWSERDAGTL